MTDALIGATGFVGETLRKVKSFEACFRSTDIGNIVGRSFDTVVCAGAPAQKWIANRDPLADRLGIETLTAHLSTICCESFVLVSTVDVFPSPMEIDEDSPVNEDGLQPYGLHRRMLEKFVQAHFPRSLIVRLPGLVGPGLRKNVVFDFLNDNQVAKIDSRGVFQFYPMVNLWYDIQTARAAELGLVHLTAEPVSVAAVSAQGFGRPFENPVVDAPARYDMWTRHAALFGGNGQYQYSARETLLAVRAYAQSEPRARRYAP